MLEYFATRLFWTNLTTTLLVNGLLEWLINALKIGGSRKKVLFFKQTPSQRLIHELKFFLNVINESFSLEVFICKLLFNLFHAFNKDRNFVLSYAYYYLISFFIIISLLSRVTYFYTNNYLYDTGVVKEWEAHIYTELWINQNISFDI